MSAQSRSLRWRYCAIARDSGRKSRVGGTRYVRKMPTPRLRPTRPESRASAYPAGIATASVIKTTMTPTKLELTSQRT